MRDPQPRDLRSSGISWAKTIPAHWNVEPFFAVFSESRIKNAGLAESNLLSLSYGRIIRKSIDSDRGLLPESFETYQIVQPGTIIFRFTDLQNDQRSLRTARATERGIITSAYGAALPKKLEPAFADYLMRAYDTTKVFYGFGGGVRQSLKLSDIARMPVIVPPAIEQRSIADYLDRETAQIDTLIAKQEQLIATLRERRFTAITVAVSEGDSSWSTGRVKSFALRLTDGAHISPETENGQFAFVSTRDVRDGQIDFENCLKTSASTYEYMVRTGCQPHIGDVLFSKDGTVGETVVVDVDQEFVVASSLVIITPDPVRVDSGFLAYALQSKRLRDQAQSYMRGAGLPRLSVGNLGRLEMAIPPLTMQHRIGAILDAESTKIDALISKAEQFIALAKERRAALITAAVTGQIDVTGKAA